MVPADGGIPLDDQFARRPTDRVLREARPDVVDRSWMMKKAMSLSVMFLEKISS